MVRVAILRYEALSSACQTCCLRTQPRLHHPPEGRKGHSGIKVNDAAVNNAGVKLVIDNAGK